MQQPLVTIIIPVYNAVPFLSQTIESALSQTFKNKEVIIVDDSSKDGSYEIARKFENVSVKVLHQRNAGAAIARNTGLAAANGEYIQFLDAGDLLSPDKIEKQVEALKGQPNKLAVCNYIQFSGKVDVEKLCIPDQSRFIYSSNSPLEFLVNLWGGNGPSNFIQTNSWLVPKTLVEKAGGWRPYRCPDDDGEFFARMILASEGIIYTPGVYNYYRMEDGANQLSSNRSHKYLMNTLLTIDLKHDYLQKKGGHEGVKKAMAKQYLDFAVYHYPSHPVLSKLALKRYRQLAVKAQPPLLGGRLIEIMKQIFGWRAARLFRYFLRERAST
ncbi:glycosyltransferase family 2 protein [Flavisolibacter nicotianae]|uniref:glycosyltransferase family 2 protein n=1 Tax=Flavisolibacter nicotianae TaxID=2364882 RepID=UPI000EB4FA0C|nr:glycosyltransferase family 2 protein [Flavisolibacter nicotianae]